MSVSAADYVPFVNTARDAELVKQIYPNSAVIRVSLQSPRVVDTVLGFSSAIWLDPAIDGLHSWADNKAASDPSDPYVQHIKKFAQYERIADQEFQKKPDKELSLVFVNSVLDRCVAVVSGPLWLSVPQFPLVSNSDKNKINRLFAQQSLAWKARRGFKGNFVLPVIITHRDQMRKKTDRNKKIAQILECQRLSGARVIWVADTTLKDHEGSGAVDDRLAALIHFHRELDTALAPESVVIAGPYWGMNLVLWARGLAKFPAIGVGGGYHYYIPGGHMTTPKARIALTPLRRRATAGIELQNWLRSALTKVPSDDPAYTELLDLARNFTTLSRPDPSRRQVAQFYKQWYEKIAKVPQPGRPLALYQDLSSAYVLGKTLSDLPGNEGTASARRPERVAEQLIRTCL